MRPQLHGLMVGTPINLRIQRRDYPLLPIDLGNGERS